jgi:hypothetical protein
MDDYDGIYNYNSLKYSPSENFDNFLFIIFYGDQNIGNELGLFLSCVVYLKGFLPIWYSMSKTIGSIDNVGVVGFALYPLMY